ncbi:jg19725 [Pararge aegeria aegeria]|uniref:Jg19725 protein n=1 Tax=Pararge aegeria aegeria TaxID=348720 RepID=A0A8S4RUG7_9NEOP|nr:jg19725 [Pararge aegeria aegeria]
MIGLILNVSLTGTADFYGLNYYTTYMIRPAKPEDKPGVWFLTGSPELNATLENPLNAYYGSSHMLPVFPGGLRKVMNWLKKQYGDIDILITENGFTTSGAQLDDYDRVDFLEESLNEVLVSIKEDNISVTGYTVWSLIDDLEWLAGYTDFFLTTWKKKSDGTTVPISRETAFFHAFRGTEVNHRSITFIGLNPGGLQSNMLTTEPA